LYSVFLVGSIDLRRCRDVECWRFFDSCNEQSEARLSINKIYKIIRIGSGIAAMLEDGRLQRSPKGEDRAFYKAHKPQKGKLPWRPCSVLWATQGRQSQYFSSFHLHPSSLNTLPPLVVCGILVSRRPESMIFCVFFRIIFAGKAGMEPVAVAGSAAEDFFGDGKNGFGAGVPFCETFEAV